MAIFIERLYGILKKQKGNWNKWILSFWTAHTNMEYNDLDVYEIVNEVADAVEQGNYRKATKKESMAVRLAALSAIVQEMQKIVENDRELAKA